jgi:hypothetical protein
MDPGGYNDDALQSCDSWNTSKVYNGIYSSAYSNVYSNASCGSSTSYSLGLDDSGLHPRHCHFAP